MAAKTGSQSPGVSEPLPGELPGQLPRKLGELAGELLAEPHRFDFFQAVRLLEQSQKGDRLGGRGDRSGDDPRGRRLPVGYDHPVDREVVRFRAQSAHSFAGSEVAQVLPPRPNGAGATPPEMLVSFLGLTGPQGVLPPHYTALLIRRIRAKDFALRDFLDLLNHRTISLFFRAWEKYRLPFRYERARLEGEAQTDLATFCLYCLVGLGTGGLRGRSQVDDECFLYYAGHFARLGRPAVALESLLEDYFELPIRVLQAQGQWLSLEAEDRSLLPSAENRKGRNCQLGASLIAGERVWDVQSKVRLRVGPLDYAQFRAFLPAGDALRPLCRLTRHYLGPEFSFDVQLVLKAKEAPACRLTGEGPDRPCLGWNTWVRCNDFDADRDDAVFADVTAGP